MNNKKLKNKNRNNRKSNFILKCFHCDYRMLNYILKLLIFEFVENVITLKKKKKMFNPTKYTIFNLNFHICALIINTLQINILVNHEYLIGFINYVQVKLIKRQKIYFMQAYAQFVIKYNILFCFKYGLSQKCINILFSTFYFLQYLLF